MLEEQRATNLSIIDRKKPSEGSQHSLSTRKIQYFVCSWNSNHHWACSPTNTAPPPPSCVTYLKVISTNQLLYNDHYLRRIKLKRSRSSTMRRCMSREMGQGSAMTSSYSEADDALTFHPRHPQMVVIPKGVLLELQRFALFEKNAPPWTAQPTIDGIFPICSAADSM